MKLIRALQRVLAEKPTFHVTFKVEKKARKEQGTEWLEYRVDASGPEQEEVGHYFFQVHELVNPKTQKVESILIVDTVATNPQYLRRGIATQAYVFIEKETGLKVRPNGAFRKDGKWLVSGYHMTREAMAFWNQPNRPFGIPRSEMVHNGQVFTDDDPTKGHDALDGVEIQTKDKKE
jgi:hypothetical protein